ncbi:unnamed protein product, partial [Fusarium fujikuroi]
IGLEAKIMAYSKP